MVYTKLFKCFKPPPPITAAAVLCDMNAFDYLNMCLNLTTMPPLYAYTQQAVRYFIHKVKSHFWRICHKQDMYT